MSQLTVVQKNSLPANIEDEADALLASTQTHERLLKFKKGKFFAMDDEVALGHVLINAQTSGFGGEAEILCSTRALPGF